jgi:hypothetical protein
VRADRRDEQDRDCADRGRGAHGNGRGQFGDPVGGVPSRRVPLEVIDDVDRVIDRDADEDDAESQRDGSWN